MIPTHKLHHAVTLAEHGNFRRAADALNLTQPALTRSIQSLEQILGVRLFDRSRGGVETTALGAELIERAREILLGVADLEHEIDFLQGLGTGTLAVSLGPYPAALSGKRAVARFLTAHPEIRCRVRVAGFAEVADDVASGRCELGLADLYVATERGLTTEVVVDRQGYFFARPRHPLVARRRCSLADLSDYPWASTRFPKRDAIVMPADFGRAGRRDLKTGEFVPAIEAEMMLDLLAVAHDSDILVAATLTMAEEDINRGRLAVIPFREPWLRLHYGFISRPNRTFSPTTLRFMDIVREIESELDQREAALRKRFL